MDYLTDILADFHDRLSDISKLYEVNSEIIQIFKNDLNAVKKDVKQTGKFGGLLQKIDRQLKMLDQIQNLPELAPNYKALREQSIVLMVSGFEVFISDVFRAIANNDPDYYTWPDKDKKIAIDVESFSSSFTLGDAIIGHLSNKQYSFQDLGSIINATSDYLGVTISIDSTTRDNIVLGTSFRHSIIHKGSRVDKQFLSQTRDVRGLRYNEGNKLDISNNDVGSVRKSIEDFASYFIQALIQRDDV